MAIYYVGFPLLVLIAVLDATFIKLFEIWGGAPNLMLMVIVSWALMVDLQEALPWAVIGGIMRDLLSVAPTGSSALAFIIIVVVIDTFIPVLSWRNIIIPPIVVFISTFVYDLILVGLLIAANYSRPIFFGITYVTLPGAITNVVLVLVVYRTIGSINTLLRPQRASMLE